MTSEESRIEDVLEDEALWNDELENGELEEEDVLKADFQKVKDATKTAMGLGHREEYENTYQYIYKHVSNNGIWGFIKGATSAMLAVFGNAIHVLLSNMIFGNAEHFNFNRAIEQAIGRDELDKETKDLKKQKKEERQKSKDKSEKEESVAKKEEKEKITAPEMDKEKTPEPDDIPETPLFIQELNEVKTPEVDSYMKEVEENIAQVVKDPHILDDVITSAFKYSAVEKAFEEFQLIPHVDHNSDKILLFQEDRDNDLDKIPYIKKEDILTGNAQALGAALYKEDPDGRFSSMLAAAQAVVLSAKLKNEIYSEPLGDARQSMNNAKSDFVLLSYAITDCPNNTAGLLYSVLAPENESVQLYYKNSYIGTIDLLEPFEKNADKIYEHMIEIDKEIEKNVYTIGDNVTFYKESENTVVIEANGESRSFPLTQERDMKEIAEFISEKCPNKTDVSQIDAMLIGAKMNPYMEKAVDENGSPVNPFTNKVVEIGDLVLTQDEGVPKICKYDIDISTAIGMAGCAIEDMKDIAYIPTDGISYQMEALEEVVKAGRDESRDEPIQESLLSMNAMVFGSIETDVPRPFDIALTTNGHEAYEEMKNNAVLDGKDVSDVYTEEYEEPECDSMYMDAEELLREAEEAMEQAGYETEQEER